MINLDKNELIEIGVQFGSPVRWRHPQMLPYIYKEAGKSILDLKKIIASCQDLNAYLQTLIEKEKTILFLATKKSTREIVKEAAIRCGMPYIVNKWKGGFLTNFPEMKKKIKELYGLNNFLAKDGFKDLAKKDQVSLEKRRNKLQNIYEGVANLHRQPDALFVIGLNKEKTAFKEAEKNKVPVIAICNANCNPSLVDYVIPGNDEGNKSVTFFANLMADTIIEIKKGGKQKLSEGEEKDKNK
ncbi:MAG: 30S ribosomal protein S2 [Mycoplasmataceae bacterium]|nr:MAG: 30S ribosomal protein S2 [Mycoplasmataceae bacterium]